jgi:hypothetical protein
MSPQNFERGLKRHRLIGTRQNAQIEQGGHNVERLYA